MSGFRSPLFIGILVTYLVTGFLYAFYTPDWQAPDEPAHYNYVRYLAQSPGFPELTGSCYNQAYLEELKARRFPPELPLDQVCYEFYQPPLYYLLATPVFILGQGALFGVRLFSVILGAGVVALAFVIGQTIFPKRQAIAYGAMAFVAFAPMHVAILASVNNDALAELLIALILLLLVRRLLSLDLPSLQNDALMGLILGLGLLTKFTVYVVALPLVVVTLWWTPAERRWISLVKEAGIIYGLAVVIAFSWYFRNAVIYGNFDILGLIRHDEVVVGQLRPADFLAEVGWSVYLYRFVVTSFRSFWGQFGWMAVPMDPRVYLMLLLLTLTAVAGLFVFMKRALAAEATELSPGQRKALGVMGLTIVLMVIAYISYNTRLVQFQGRYLFPALIPLGLFYSLGLHEALAPRWAWRLAGWLILAIGGILLASLLARDLYRWALVITGSLLTLAVVRAWLVRYWPVPGAWLVAVIYGSLALLSLIAPFWFIIPFLAPS